MKNFFSLLLALPIAVSAQDTCGLKKSKDPFTHVEKLSTGFKTFEGGGLPVLISVDATPSEIDFFFWVKADGKCFDSESTAEVVFEGGKQKTTFRNTGSMNCDGTFHFVFKNLPTNPSWLNRLVTKKVSSVKLIGAKTEVIVAFNEEQKAQFQRMALCASNEGKTLLKK